MDPAQSEARKSIWEIEEMARRTRSMVAYAGADVMLIAWGIVWALGYLGNEIIPRLVPTRAAAVTTAVDWLIGTWWFVLIVAGIAVTFLVVKRHPVESATGRRIGWVWAALFGYAYVFGFLVMPFIEISGQEENMRFWKHLGAVAAVLPMFAYVVMGLWLDSYLIWIGLGVTALTLIGLVLLYPWFWIWMAVVCGGTLIGAGLLIRRKWTSE